MFKRTYKCDEFLLQETLCISEKRREQPPALKKNIFSSGSSWSTGFFVCVSRVSSFFQGSVAKNLLAFTQTNSCMLPFTLVMLNVCVCDVFFIHMSLIYIWITHLFNKKNNRSPPAVFFNFFFFSTELTFTRQEAVSWDGRLQVFKSLAMWIRGFVTWVWLSKTSLSRICRMFAWWLDAPVCFTHMALIQKDSALQPTHQPIYSTLGKLTNASRIHNKSKNEPTPHRSTTKFKVVLNAIKINIESNKYWSKTI